MKKISPEDVTIRHLEEHEACELVPIYLDALHGMTDPKSIEQWMQCNLRAFPQKICFGAWCDNYLLGYVVWAERGGFRTKAIWELEQIAVLSKYRRQGIGTKLIYDSLAEIRAHTERRGANLKLVMVTTAMDNESRRLYERVLGAREESSIEDFYNGNERIMLARFNHYNGDSVKANELLKMEHQACQEGYNNRDRTVPRQIAYLVLMFGALIALVTFVIGRLSTEPMFFVPVVIIIFLLGLLSLISLHIDLVSNLSCKRAVRDRMTEIELILSGNRRLGPENAPFRMWECIDNRNRFWDERFKYDLFKPKSEHRYLGFLERGPESSYFSFVGRFAIILWVVLIAVLMWSTLN